MKTLSTTKKLAGLFITLMTLLLSCTLVGCSGGGGSYDEQSGVTTSKMDWNSGFTTSPDGAWACKESGGNLYIKRVSDNFAFSIKNAKNFEFNDNYSELDKITPISFERDGLRGGGINLSNKTDKGDYCVNDIKHTQVGIERFPSTYPTYDKGSYCFVGDGDNSSEKKIVIDVFNNATENEPAFYGIYSLYPSNSEPRGTDIGANLEYYSDDFEFYGVVE